jgi:hypothetical protein
VTLIALSVAGVVAMLVNIHIGWATGWYDNPPACLLDVLLSTMVFMLVLVPCYAGLLWLAWGVGIWP